MANDERVKKMYYAVDFYDQAVELFDMIQNSVDGFYLTYGFHIDEDWSKSGLKKEDFDFDVDEKIKKRKTQMLINLGRVGEYVLKYVLLLKQIEDFPGQSFAEFSSKPLFNMPVRAIRNTYVNQYGISTTIADDIKTIWDAHPLQPLHDFDYLFKVIKRLYPDVTNDIYKSLELTIKENVINESNLPQEIKNYFLITLYPYLHLTDNLPIGQYQREFDRVIAASGDVFTRLRYLANNPTNKQYDLASIIELMKYLLAYARLIHETNHDNINRDVIISNIRRNYLKLKEDSIRNKEYSYSKGQLNEFVERRLREEEKRFDELVSIGKIMNSRDLLKASLYSALSVPKIKELVNSGYSNDDLYVLFSNNISPKTLQFFKERGVSSVVNINRLLSNSKLNLDKLKNVDEDHFPLLVWLDIDTVECLKENKWLDNYIVNNRGILKHFFRNYNPSEEDYKLFNKILYLGDVNENPDIIRLLDYNQFEILKQCNKDRPTDKEILKNIEENVKLFKDTQLFASVPLMLDYKNNVKVLGLLKENGFREDRPTMIDGTIFCVPYEMVKATIEKIKSDNSEFIINNNINARFYFEVTSNDDKNPSLPLRRLKPSLQ